MVNDENQCWYHKAIVASYACRNAIARNWGMGSRDVNWILEAVAKPNLFNGVVLWWSALNRAEWSRR